MNTSDYLVNPEGQLLPEVEQCLRKARKTTSVWAKRLGQAQKIETMEGWTIAAQGDYLCRGVSDEVWAQEEEKLLQKYVASGVVDEEGWEHFKPNPNAPKVQAAQVVRAFQVESRYGTLHGKAGDYLIRSTTDASDVWVVDRSIFEQTYEFIKT